MPMCTENFLNIGGRIQHRSEAAVRDCAAKMINKFRIGINDNQACIAAQPIKHRLAECPHTRPVLYKNLAIVPINRRKHLINCVAR